LYSLTKAGRKQLDVQQSDLIGVQAQLQQARANLTLAVFVSDFNGLKQVNDRFSTNSLNHDPLCPSHFVSPWSLPTFLHDFSPDGLRR
jgi:hypothetical protein